jgi:hypothetical protein
MLTKILIMLGFTMLQNASFTLVSRARNSPSITFHIIAAILSNGTYLLVLKNVVTSLDNFPVMAAYVIGSVVGGVIMHKLSMKYFEKWKWFNPKKK